MSARHSRDYRARRRAGIRLPTFAERFNSRVAWVGECLEWRGERDRLGYGRISRNGRSLLAHRAALERLLGPIPDELDVMHSCDNPPCVNPAHLRPAPTVDNIADMVAKGRYRNGLKLHPERAARGERHGTRTHPEAYAKGADHPNARLTSDQVVQIRERYAAGGISQRALAREFGVRQGTIWPLLHGLSRKAG